MNNLRFRTRIARLAIAMCIVCLTTAWNVCNAQTAMAPIITKQPVGGTFAKNAKIRLFLQASSPDGGALTYQWHIADNETDAGTPILGATSSILQSITPATAGTYYYRCAVTNMNTSGTADVESQRTAVRIIDEERCDSLRNGCFSYFTHPTTGAIVEYNNSIIKWDDRTWGVHPINRILGWNTTHNSHEARYRGKQIELQGVNGTGEANYNNTAPNANNAGHGKNGGNTAPFLRAELAAADYASIYQDIATDPGRIYSWSLEHIAKDPVGGSDVMAVIIGPSINYSTDYNPDIPNRYLFNISVQDGGYAYGGENLGPYDYPYGQHAAAMNGSSPIYNQSSSYFYDILMQLAQLKGKADPRGLADFSGQSFVQPYNGYNYYVYMCATGNKAWKKYSGFYTIPEGVGTSVFSFVGVRSKSPNIGNILDNIVFSSGVGIVPEPAFAPDGAGIVRLTSRLGFAYGLVEIRGSTVIYPSGIGVSFEGSPLGLADAALVNLPSHGNQTWYYPNAVGDLVFRGLSPGGVYRVVGIPVGAISEGLGVNLDAGLVLDDGYYSNFMMLPVDVGNNVYAGQVSSNNYVDGQGTCRASLILTNTSDRTEYALLTPEGSVEHVWVRGLGIGTNSRLVFDNLELDSMYHIVARPLGYFEIDYSSARSTPVAVRTAPHCTGAGGVSDILPSDLTYANPGASLSVDQNLSEDWYYNVYDAGTRRFLLNTWSRAVQPLSSLTFNGMLSNHTYHVVKKVDTLPGTIPMDGVRLYPWIDLSLNWIDEQVGSGSVGSGNVSTSTMLRMYANRPSLPPSWIIGSADQGVVLGTWQPGTGVSPLSLGEPLSGMSLSILDTLGALGSSDATLQYRYRAELDNWGGSLLNPVSELTIPARPAAPSVGYSDASKDCNVKYENEYLTLEAVKKSMEYSTDAGLSWSAGWLSLGGVEYGRSMSDLGWNGMLPKSVHLRWPADVGVKFASYESTAQIVSRGIAPEGILDFSGSDLIIGGLSPNTYYELQINAGTWTSYQTSVGSTSLTIPGAYAYNNSYLLRYRYTSQTPHSRVQDLNNVLRIPALEWGDVVWSGSSPGEKSIEINNISTTIPATINGMSIVDASSPVFSIFPSFSGTLDIAAGGSNTTSYKLRTTATSVGAYTAILRLSTTTVSSIDVPISLNIVRATWPSSGVASVKSRTPSSLTIKIGGLPSGLSAIEWKLGSGSWPSSPNTATVSSDSCIITLSGLSEATQYTLYYRLPGGSTHYTLNGQSLTAWTPYSSVDACEVDYQSEQLNMRGGYTSSNYSIKIRNTGVTSWSSLPSSSMPYNVSSIADLGDFEVSVSRVGPETQAPPSEPYIYNIVGRTQSPGMPSSVIPPSSSNGNKGTIGYIPAPSRGLQYHILPSADYTTGWIPIADGTTGATLDPGSYLIRYPATSTAFASRSDTVTLAVINFNASIVSTAQSNPSGNPYTRLDSALTFSVSYTSISGLSPSYTWSFPTGLSPSSSTLSSPVVSAESTGSGLQVSLLLSYKNYSPSIDTTLTYELDILKNVWSTVGSATIIDTTSTSLGVRVSGLPISSTAIEWRYKASASTSWSGWSSASVVSGVSEFTVSGLVAATKYDIEYHIKADASHDASTEQSISGWTRYAVPDAVELNYENEQLTLRGGYNASELNIRHKGSGALSWVSVVTLPYSVSGVADSLNFEVKVNRKSSGVAPNIIGQSLDTTITIQGRASAPSVSTSVTPSWHGTSYLGSFGWSSGLLSGVLQYSVAGTSSWSEATITGGASDILNLVAGSYLVRYKATSTAFASRSLSLSIPKITFACTIEKSPSVRQMKIDSVSTFTSSPLSLSLSGLSSPVEYTWSLPSNDTLVYESPSSSSSVSPVLRAQKAGDDIAVKLRLKYTWSGTSPSLTIDTLLSYTLDIRSNDWSTVGSATIIDTTSTSLGVRVSGLPILSTAIEWRYKASASTSWSGWSSVSVSSGGVSDFTISGLTAATKYDIEYHIKADASHNASSDQTISGWTRYAVPDAVEVNYVSEQLTLRGGYNASELNIRHKGSGALSWVSVVTLPYSVSGVADSLNFEVKVNRKSSGVAPNIIGQSLDTTITIQGRAAVPSVPDSITPSCGATGFMGGLSWRPSPGYALEYRSSLSSGSWSPVGLSGTMSTTGLSLPSGSYSVRRSSSSTSFASRSLTCNIPFIYYKTSISSNAPGHPLTPRVSAGGSVQFSASPVVLSGLQPSYSWSFPSNSGFSTSMSTESSPEVQIYESGIKTVTLRLSYPGWSPIADTILSYTLEVTQSTLLASPFKHATIRGVISDGSYSSPVPVYRTDTIVYSLTASNYSAVNDKITVVDTLPSGLELLSGSISDGGVYESSSRKIEWKDLSVGLCVGGVPSSRAVTFKSRPSSGQVLLGSAPGYIKQPGSMYANRGWVISDNGSTLTPSVPTYHRSEAWRVSFASGSGGTLQNGNPQVVDDNSYALPASVAASPSSGYNFSGWSHPSYIDRFGNTVLSVSGVTDFTTIAVKGDITLTAEFSAIPYDIKYHLKSGDSGYLTSLPLSNNPTTYDVTGSVSINNGVGQPQPVRAGYIFTGWTDDSLLTQQSPSRVISWSAGQRVGNSSFTAQWDTLHYTINYDMNLDGDNDIQTSPSVDPNAPGYIKGLYPAQNASSNPSHYDIEHSVSLSSPSRNGYSFAGWRDRNGVSVTSISQGSIGDTTLYAQWILRTYNITWNHPSGVGSASAPSPANPLSYTVEMLPLSIVGHSSWSGHTFKGWSGPKSGYTSGMSVHQALTFSIPAGSYDSLSYESSWDTDDYAIHYHLNDGVGVYYRVSDSYKQSLSPVSYQVSGSALAVSSNGAPVRDGYTFLGWLDDSVSSDAASYPKYIAAGSTGIKSFTAQWDTIAYTITYVHPSPSYSGESVNGPALPNPSGYKVTSLPLEIKGVPVRKGYTFDGWVGSGGMSPLTPSKSVQLVPGAFGNRSYESRWTQQTYAIRYYYMSGVPVSPALPLLSNPTSYNVTQTVTIDNSLVASQPVRAGYTFKGWSDDSIVTLPKDTFKLKSWQPGVEARDYSLTAAWSLNSYVINYDGNLDGDNNPSTNPVSPVYNWSHNPSYTSYTYEDSPISVNSMSNNPTRSGYSFSGWRNLHGDAVSVIGSHSTGDTLLIAQWSATSYSISYDLNDQSGVGSATNSAYNLSLSNSSYNADSITLVDKVIDNTPLLHRPVRPGYDFLGWSSDEGDWSGNRYVITIAKGSTGSRHYTAHWEKHRYAIVINHAGGQLPSGVDSVQWADNSYGRLGGYYTIETPSFRLTNPEWSTAAYHFSTWRDDSLSMSTGGQTNQLTLTVPSGSTGNRSYTALWSADTFSIEWLKGDNAPYPATLPVNPGNTEKYDANSLPITIDNSASNPAIRPGYTFAGWSGGSKIGSVVTSEVTMQQTFTLPSSATGNKSYTAKWSALTYAIHYNGIPLGVIAPSRNSYTADDLPLFTSKIEISDSLQRLGYHFTGWLDDSVSSVTTQLPIRPIVINAGAQYGGIGVKSYTASWDTIYYHLDINYGGGALQSGQNVTTSGNLTRYTVASPSFTLTRPSRIGYTFTGWIGTGIPSGAPVLDVTVSNGSVGDRLYTASWSTDSYNISYNLEYGILSLSGVPVRVPSNSPSNPSDYSVTSPDLPLQSPFCEGYVFTGWTDDNTEQLTATPHAVTIASGSVGNRSFTAHWSARQYELHINYGGGYLSSGMSNTDAGAKSHYTVETSSFALTTPVRDGYTFVGWTDDSISTAQSPQLSVTISQGSVGHRSYTAQWSIDTYPLTINYNGGSLPAGITDSVRYSTVSSGNLGGYYTYETPSFTLINPVKSGYASVGWTGTGLPVTYPYSSSVTVPIHSTGARGYATQWQAIPYDIYYHVPSGVVSPSRTGYSADELQVSPITISNSDTLSRVGYHFIGWTNDSLPQTPPLPGVSNPAVKPIVIAQGTTGTLSYTACWHPVTYTISYTLNDNAVYPASPYIPTYTDYTPETPTLTLSPVPVRAGWHFTGWSDDAVSGDQPHDPMLLPIGSVGSRSYTAHWSAVSYNIHYHYGSGGVGPAVPNPVSYSALSTFPITISNAPSRVGYTFAGWTDDSVSVPQTPQLTIALQSGSSGTRSYTAAWTPITYQISCDLNGGSDLSGSDPHVYHYTIEDPDFSLVAPVKSGAAFVGWLPDPPLTADDVSVDPLWIRTGTYGNKNYKAKWGFKFADDTIYRCNEQTDRYTIVSGGDGQSYEWLLPDGSSQSGATLTSIPALSSGRYILRTNYGSRVIADTIYVLYMTPSDLSIKLGIKGDPKIGRPVRFTSSVDRHVPFASYSWNFGTDAILSSSSSLSDASPTVSWNTTGLKTVSLTVTLSGGVGANALVCTRTLSLSFVVRDVRRGIYIDAAADSAIADGESWRTAYPTLQEALLHASAGDFLYVAGGDYYPDPDASFTLLSDSVEIYGGFVSGTRNLNSRVLSGAPSRLIGNGASVFVVGGACAGSRIDGFTIEGGASTAGGGIYLSGAKLTLANLVIRDNRASDKGGGLYLYGGAPVMYNIEASGNVSLRDGGGIYCEESAPLMTHTTVSGNMAATTCGGIYNRRANTQLFNAIVWGNRSGVGESLSDNLYNHGGADNRLYNATVSASNNNVEQNGDYSLSVASQTSPYIAYSLVEGALSGGSWNASAGVNGGGNVAGSPAFEKDGFDGSGRMQRGVYIPDAYSPATNSARLAYTNNIRVRFAFDMYTCRDEADWVSLPYDLRNTDRRYGNFPDMGAYESNETIGGGTHVKRPVLIPYTEGVTCDPSFGVYYVEGHQNFTLTLTAKDGYSIRNIQVKTGIPRYDEQGGIGMSFASDSSAVHATIYQITDALTLSITGVELSSKPGDNETQTQTRVWSHGGRLHIANDTHITLCVHTLTGLLITERQLNEGVTSMPLERGVYIVTVNNKRTTKVIID